MAVLTTCGSTVTAVEMTPAIASAAYTRLDIRKITLNLQRQALLPAQPVSALSFWPEMDDRMCRGFQVLVIILRGVLPGSHHIMVLICLTAEQFRYISGQAPKT